MGDVRSSHVLLKGAAIMTVFSLIGKLLGVLLRLFLSARIGSEGIGLYQLLMSVYGLFAALSTAGLTVAVSRLAAEKEEKNPSDAQKLLKVSIPVSLAVSGLATILLLLSAPFLAETAVGDRDTAPALCILAVSMPFMAVASCFKGWFIAKRQVLRGSSASLFEQCVKFAVMALLLGVVMADTNDIHRLCVGIVLGITVGECSSFCYLLAAYRFLRGRQSKEIYHPTETTRDSVRSLTAVMIPIALSVMVTSLLHTAENLLIPAAFGKFSGDRSVALSEFGVIRGMVIPLLFFPFAFLQSLVSVMIPEISRLQASQGKDVRDRQIGRILSVSFLFGIATGGLFFALPEALGGTFYPGEETAEALRLLALITPMMYVQTICDGLLKAVNGQKYTLRYSVYNSILRLGVIFTLIPLTGSKGYLLLLMVSNTMEFLLCYFRLKSYSCFAVGAWRGVLLPIACSGLAGLCAEYTTSLPWLKTDPACAMAGSAVYLIVFLLSARPLYLPLIKKRIRS